MFKPLDRSEKDSREGKIRFLLRRKFPALFNVPRVSPEEYPALKEQAEQYRKVLDAKQDAELDSYYTMEKAEARRAKLDRDEAARPFNQPFARSDVSRWAKMSYWRPDEAVALSLGCEPKYAQWDELQHLTLVSAFASKFASQREIVMRARAMGQLSDMTIPSHFMAWAERMQFPMPDELSVAVKELGRQVADWKSLFDNQLRETEEAVELAKHLQGQYSSEMHRQSKAILEMAELNQAITKKMGAMLEQSQSENRVLTARIEELQRTRSNSNAERFGTRERESVLKLVIGMAIGGYGYDPNASRSKTVGDIRDDLDRVGLSLDDDTVRKYLAAGKELLPGDKAE